MSSGKMMEDIRRNFERIKKGEEGLNVYLLQFRGFVVASAQQHGVEFLYQISYFCHPLKWLVHDGQFPHQTGNQHLNDKKIILKCYSLTKSANDFIILMTCFITLPNSFTNFYRDSSIHILESGYFTPQTCLPEV
jgi:hypothetical protein